MTTTLSISDFISLGLIRDLELLASRNDCVLWIRNLEYNHQLYVSSTYHIFFEMDCFSLYSNPLSWNDLLAVEDSKTYVDELKKNRVMINPDYTAVYCIRLRSGLKRWFMDRSLQLPIYSKSEKIIIGCALPFLDNDTIELHQSKYSEKLDYIITQYYQLLTKPSVSSSSKSNENNITKAVLNTLTKREIQILKLFIQGNTIRQVADEIHLSCRTVEDYLTKLKKKLNCDSKSELIMKAIENGWLLINL